jgi:hypothetical protein
VETSARLPALSLALTLAFLRPLTFSLAFLRPLTFSLPLRWHVLGNGDTLFPGALLHLLVVLGAVGSALLLGVHGAHFRLVVTPLLLAHQVIAVYLVPILRAALLLCPLLFLLLSLLLCPLLCLLLSLLLRPLLLLLLGLRLGLQRPVPACQRCARQRSE